MSHIDYLLQMEHVDTIRKNYVQLRQHIIVDERFLSFLIKDEILSDTEIDSIKVATSMLTQAADLLLGFLMRVSHEQFLKVLNAFEETDQGQVCNILTGQNTGKHNTGNLLFSICCILIVDLFLVYA